jgi:hypothetical protein
MSGDSDRRDFFAQHKPWSSPGFGQWTSDSLPLEAIVLNEVFNGKFIKFSHFKVKRVTAYISKFSAPKRVVRSD